MLSLQKFKKGDDIINRGDTANSYYIIKEGEVDILNKKGKYVRTLTAGQTFGEAALLLYKEEKRGATVQAKSEQVICLALGQQTLKDTLGNQLQEIFFKNKQKWALRNDKNGQHFSDLQIQKIF